MSAPTRTASIPDHQPLALMYHRLFLQVHDAFVNRYQKNLVRGMQRFRQAGKVEVIASAALRHGLPSIYLSREYPVSGGLMSYGIDVAEPYRQAATYVDRILKGAKPGELPVQAASKFEMVVNLKTAKALGITVPPTMLGRAEEVIE